MAKRLEIDGFVAEFYVREQAMLPRLIFFAITRKGSSEVLSIGHSRTARQAEQDARAVIGELSQAAQYRRSA